MTSTRNLNFYEIPVNKDFPEVFKHFSKKEKIFMTECYLDKLPPKFLPEGVQDSAYILSRKAAFKKQITFPTTIGYGYYGKSTRFEKPILL